MAMTIRSMAQDSMAKDMLKLTTGLRINSAADDAAGLAISEKLKSQAEGMKVGTDNTEHMGNLINTAEGGLSGAQDMLQRMRELGVQASNGTLTDDDRQAIQSEIDELKKGIQDSVQNTEYNTMKLLDGSFADKNVASNPDGTGMQISIENTSLATLGIDDFDVTSGNFSLDSIDKALDMVSKSRASLGATSNALEHVANANKNAYVNEVASLSRIADADMAEYITNVNKNKVIDQVNNSMIRRQNEQAQNKVNLLQ